MSKVWEWCGNGVGVVWKWCVSSEWGMEVNA